MSLLCLLQVRRLDPRFPAQIKFHQPSGLCKNRQQVCVQLETLTHRAIQQQHLPGCKNGPIQCCGLFGSLQHGEQYFSESTKKNAPSLSHVSVFTKRPFNGYVSATVWSTRVIKRPALV